MSRNGRGVERDHLDWASQAARREGLSLDEWLDSRPVADRSLDPAPRYASPEPAYGRHSERAREATPASYSALNKQLEALSDRLERIGGTSVQAPAARTQSEPRRREARDDGRLNNVLATLDGIERRIQAMKQPEPFGEATRDREAFSSRDAERQGRDRPFHDRPDYDREPRRGGERRLDRDLDALDARRDMLEGYDDRGRREPDRLMREDIDGHFRALSSQIDTLRRETPTAAIARLQDDIAAMKTDLRRRDPVATLSDRDVAMMRAIAEKVDLLSRSRADGEQIDRLREDFADLRRIVMSNDIEGSLQSLESGYRHIIERLDDMRRSMNDPDLFDRLAERIGGIDRAMKAIPQIEQIAAIEKQIARLGGQIDEFGRYDDPRLGSIESQLGEMRQALSSVDTGQAVMALSGQLQAITEKLDVLETIEREPAAAPVDPLSTQAIDRLADQITDIRALITDDHHADNFRVLTERINDISVKLDAAERNRDTRAGFAALDQRISEIGDRLDATRDAPGQDLSGLEARLAQTMAQIEKLVPQADMGDAFSALEGRIAEIGAKIEKFDPTVPARDLEALWNLEATLERIDNALRRTSESTALDQLDQKVSALSVRLDEISSKPIDLSEVTELRNEITDMREQFARPIPVDMSVFEKQIRSLVDQISNAPVADHREELQRLEDQIVSITRILDATDSRFATLSSIEDALSRIQTHLSGSQSDATDIAREAARAAVQELSDTRPASGSDEQIRSLQDDLKRFLSTSHDSAERTQDTLVSLHDTLQSVAGRLAKLEKEGVQPTSAPNAAWSDRDPEPEAQPVPRRRVGEEHYEPPVFADGAPTLDGRREAALAGDPRQERLPMEAPATDHMARALAEEELNRAARVAADAATTRPRPKPEDNMPLEPGSGRPAPSRADDPAQPEPAAPAEIRALNERPQDVSAHSSLEAAVRDRKADFIAAARRAAQAAAADPSTLRADDDEDTKGKSWLKAKLSRKAKKKEPEPAFDEAPSLDQAAALYNRPDPDVDDEPKSEGRSGGLFGTFRKHRKPLLMAAAGLVFVLVGLQAMKIMLAPSRTHTAAQRPATEQAEMAIAPVPDKMAATAPAKAYNEPAPTAQTAATAPRTATTNMPDTAPTASTPAAQAAAPVSAQSMPALAPADPPEAIAVTAPTPPDEIGSLALRQDAANGDADAQFEVAARYTSGIGVKSDLKIAAEWYERAAVQGNGPAQYRLGSLYEKGSGIKKDVAVAKRWYQRAAEQGNIKAMHNLAVLYAEGADGAPDLTTAAQWFERAADRGVRDSQFNLGILYTRGLGVSRDLSNAYKWFALAALGGDADAGKKRDEIANALDRQGLAAARLAVETWQPKTIVEKANKPRPMPAKWGTVENRQAAAAPAPAAETAGLISKAQTLLSQLGYNPGPSDGVPGPRTRDAVKAFQRSVGLKETGIVDEKLLRKMTKSMS